MKFIVLLTVLLGSYFIDISLKRLIEKVGASKSVNTYRIQYLQRTVSLLVITSTILVLLLLLGIEYSQVTVFLSSAFAVLGVALFAQWSILSNITASLIIFFAFPYRVGDYVKIIDKDEDVRGIIEEIGLFHVLVKRLDGSAVSYPNTLILQKGVIKLPEDYQPPEQEPLDAIPSSSRPAASGAPTPESKEPAL